MSLTTHTIFIRKKKVVNLTAGFSQSACSKQFVYLARHAVQFSLMQQTVEQLSLLLLLLSPPTMHHRCHVCALFVSESHCRIEAVATHLFLWSVPSK